MAHPTSSSLTTERRSLERKQRGHRPPGPIGNQFALYEAQLILATILSRYQLRLLPEAVVAPEPLVTLRPRGDLLMTVRRTQEMKQRLSDEKEGAR